jgi:hypothetical protein
MKIFQGGYMSGDTYTASALLAFEPAARILLIKDTKEPQDNTDDRVLPFYTECGLKSRVTVLDLSGSEVGAKALYKALSDSKRNAPPKKLAFKGVPKTIDEAMSELYYNVDPKNEWPRLIVSVTGLVANKFAKDAGAAAKVVAEIWKVGKLKTDTKFALWEYAGTKFRKTGWDIRDNIVVLWSRQSGKGGGAHVELDSSFTAIRQLAAYFAPAKATVMLAGDEKTGKLEEIAGTSPQILNVAGMWKDQFWKDHFAGITVLAQLALFKFLAEDYNVVHVGMRSGMLECMALLGMPVCYLEPAACPSGSRMLAFHKAGIPYSRVQVDWPAGLTSMIAQMSIKEWVNSNEKSGSPAPSLTFVRNRIEQKANAITNYRPFQNSYGDDEQAAQAFAKGELLGFKNMTGSIKEGTVKRRMARARGFNDEDLDKIVKAIEAEFR